MEKEKAVRRIIPFVKAATGYKAQSNAAVSKNLLTDSLVSIVIDILVMPSIWYEAYGLSILEAFANKVPVIATDIGGIPEIVHDGHNGLLFKRGDVLDLKQKMEKVINGLGLIQKFRENIPRVKFINEECDKLFSIYEKLARV